MQADIRKILKTAIHAPSGENCQPWRFVVRGNEISIFNIPERDDSLYNWGQRASFVAHGALIENIEIAANTLGYKISATAFPDPQDQNLTARIVLERMGPQNHPLYPFITKRATNRKFYKPASISHEQQDELKQSGESNAQIFLTTDKKKISRLGVIVAANEEVLFGNREMHRFFFNHINWTEEEEKERRTGFYTKELEFTPQQLSAVKIFRYWPVMNIVRFLSIPRFIAKENSKIYASASAMGVLVIDTTNEKDFLLAGRIFQRIWLKATKMGLSFQPLTGILFLNLGIKESGIKELSQTHIQLVKDKYEEMRTLFNVPSGKIIAMMFRVGDGGEPSARALRLPINLVIKNS